jgi:hypothetical protein
MFDVFFNTQKKPIFFQSTNIVALHRIEHNKSLNQSAKQLYSSTEIGRMIIKILF